MLKSTSYGLITHWHCIWKEGTTQQFDYKNSDEIQAATYITIPLAYERPMGSPL